MHTVAIWRKFVAVCETFSKLSSVKRGVFTHCPQLVLSAAWSYSFLDALNYKLYIFQGRVVFLFALVIL